MILSQSAFLFSRAPFNWRTPSGYLIVFTIQTITIVFMVHMSSCFMSLLIGSCWIVMTFSDELKSELNALNESKSINNQELTRKLSNFVQFHTETIQLS